MKIVLQVHAPGGEGQAIHHRLDAFPAYVGRAFHNHVILSDPHVSAEHLRIDWNDGAWVVSDLGSDNGLFVNGKPLQGRIVPLQSGDRIRVGQTDIFFYTPTHPVPPALQIQKRHPALSWLSSSKSMWISFALLILCSAGSVYDGVFSDDGLLKPLVGGVVFTIAAALVWAALWAAGGRLAKKKAYFKAHFSLAAFYISANIALMKLMDTLHFISSEHIAATLLEHALFFAATAVLLGASLFFGTPLPPRKCKWAGVFFSLGLLASMQGMERVIMEDFVAEPMISIVLEPSFHALLPTTPVDAFLAEGKELFDGSF